MTLHGRAKNGVIVLQNDITLPDGTPVEVTPLSDKGGNALAKGQIGSARSEKNGLAAIYGKWPGDESDEEVEKALKELS